VATALSGALSAAAMQMRGSVLSICNHARSPDDAVRMPASACGRTFAPASVSLCGGDVQRNVERVYRNPITTNGTRASRAACATAALVSEAGQSAPRSASRFSPRWPCGPPEGRIPLDVVARRQLMSLTTCKTIPNSRC